MVPYCPTGPLLTSKLGKAIIMTSKLGKRSDLMDRDEILRKAKAEKRGSFANRIYLENVEDKNG